MAVKNFLIEWITVNQNSKFCALVDCNQPAMTVLLEYNGSLAWMHAKEKWLDKMIVQKPIYFPVKRYKYSIYSIFSTIST